MVESDRIDGVHDLSCRVGVLERDVAIILSNYATKADLARMEGRLDTKLVQLELRLVKWVIGAMVGGVLAALAAAANLFKLYAG